MAASEPFAVFLSYSRGASEQLAVDLQAALERFAKPWYRLRAIRVFRDDSSMSANTALWSTIQTGLTQSSWFVLLATPASAASPWVAQEIEWWLQHRGPQRLLIVQAEGDLYWDRVARAFSSTSTAIPAVLHCAYPEEPRWIDMRWYAADPDRGKADPRFTERVADLSAAVRGIERDTLVGENVRQHRRSIRLARGAIVVLSLLLVLSLAAGLLAIDQRRAAIAQRNEARTQANQADARGLAARAISLAATKVDTAMLLAVEGYRRDPSLDTEDGLLTALNGARYLVGYRPALPRDVYDVALTPDRTTLLVMTTGGDLRTFDPQTGREAGGPLVRGVTVPGVIAVSRDGRRVAYGADDGVRVIDRDSGRPVGQALGGPIGFTQEFSRDGDTLVTSTEGWTGFRAFDLASGRKLGEVPDPGFPVALDVSPRADEVVVGLSQPALRRYRFDGSPAGAEVSVADRGAVRLLSYSPDGSRVAVGHDYGIVQVVDATTLRPVGRRFTVRSASRVVDLSFTPSGRLVAATSDDGSIQVAEVETGEVIATFAGLSGPVQAEFLDENRVLALTSGEAAEFDLRRPTSLGTTAPRPGGVLGLQRSHGGDLTMAVGEESRLDRVDGALASVRGSPAPPGADAVAIALDHATAAWHVPPKTPSGVGAVVVADATTGAVRTRIDVPGDRNGQYYSTRMAFSADAAQVAVGTSEGRLTVVDVAAGRVVVGDVPVDFSALPALCWSHDGRTLYAGGQDGLLKSVDPVTGRVDRSIPLSPGTALTGIEPVPDSSLVAVSSESGFVYLVDTAAWQLSGEPMSAAATSLQTVAVSPSGQRVAALGSDGALRLWDRATRRPIGPPLAVHRDWSFALDYLDETRLMSGGLDRQLIGWDLRPESLVRQACRLAGRDLTAAEWNLYLPTRPYRRTCSE